MGEPIQQAEPAAKAKRSGGLARYIIWGLGIVFLYVLSFGPAKLLEAKGLYSMATKKRIVNPLYAPMRRAYDNPLLHKPLGMYLHLWCPDLYDRGGESFVIIGPTKYDSLQAY
jgi:hypothetical protein